jgi:hypothetical protein
LCFCDWEASLLTCFWGKMKNFAHRSHIAGRLYMDWISRSRRLGILRWLL